GEVEEGAIWEQPRLRPRRNPKARRSIGSSVRSGRSCGTCVSSGGCRCSSWPSGPTCRPPPSTRSRSRAWCRRSPRCSSWPGRSTGRSATSSTRRPSRTGRPCWSGPTSGASCTRRTSASTWPGSPGPTGASSWPARWPPSTRGRRAAPTPWSTPVKSSSSCSRGRWSSTSTASPTGWPRATRSTSGPTAPTAGATPASGPPGPSGWRSAPSDRGGDLALLLNLRPAAAEKEGEQEGLAMRKNRKNPSGPPRGHALSPKEQAVPLRKQLLIVLLGLAAIALIVSPILLIKGPKGVTGKELSDVLTAVDKGSIDGQAIQWIEVDDNSRMVILNLADGSQVGAHYPDYYGGTLVGRLESTGLPFETDPPASPSIWPTLLMTFLPVALIIGFLVWFARRSGVGGAKAFAAAKATEVGDVPLTRFSEVVGCDEAVEELAEIVTFLHQPERFAAARARMPR